MIIPPLMTLGQARIYAMQGKPIRLTEWTEAQNINWPLRAISAVNTTTDVFTLTAHGFAHGTPLRFSTVGTLPTVKLSDFDGLTGATISIDEFEVYAIPVTVDTFKLTAWPDFGNGLLDCTNAGSVGSGNVYVQRATAREWLIFESHFWWVVANGFTRLSRATDLTAAEFAATNWTTLTAEEMAELAVATNEVTLPRTDGEGGNSNTVGDPPTIDTAPGTASTVPEGSEILQGSSGGGSSGGGGSSAGGSSGGGGSSDGGSSGGGSDGESAGAGGVSGGGGGGAPAANSGADVGDDSDDAGKQTVTPSITATELGHTNNIMAIDPLSEGRGYYVRRTWFQVTLEDLDYSSVKGSAFTLYLVTLDWGGKRIWSRWMHAGETTQGSGFAYGFFVRGSEEIPLYFKVRGPAGTKSYNLTIQALD